MQQVYVLITTTFCEGEKIHLHGPFADAGGYCYIDVPFEEEEAYTFAYRQHLSNHTEYNVNIIIIEAESNRICGCYPAGSLFESCQWDRRADRRYHARCETTKAIFLPPDLRPISPVRCTSSSFIFPLKEYDNAFDSVMTKMTGGTENQNLVLYPPTLKLYNEVGIKDYHSLFDKFQETLDCRLLPKLLLASQNTLKTGEDKFASYCLAYAFVNLAKPDMAQDILVPLLKSDPTYVDALILCGISEMRLGQMTSSIETLNQALALEDADMIRYYLGLAYDWYGYTSTAYRQLNSIHDPYWKDIVRDILIDMERNTPYVTGVNSNSKLPAAYPMPWACPKRSKIEENFQGKPQYICFIRHKGIKATSEEFVRQEFIQHLVLDLGYPKSGILVEESLAHIDRSLRDRVDILVVLHDIQKRHNLLMVECKASHVPLDGVVGEQALRYNEIINADYIVLTNGIQTQVYRMDRDSKKYVAVIGTPTYKQLLTNTGIKTAPQSVKDWERPDYASLSDHRVQQTYVDVHFGNGTDNDLRPAILNLSFLLRDKNHTLSCPLAAPPFTIIKDNGLTEKAVGNPSGGRYQDYYRWFTVQDNHKRVFQVYLAVFASYTCTAKLDSEYKGGKSTLLVAVDRRGQPISVLQIDLVKHFRASASGHVLTHSGVRSRAKIEDLIPHIESQAPYLLNGKDRITFGCMDTSNNLLMSDPQTAKVIANIISYSLIRFQLRKTTPNKKKASIKR